MRDFSCPSCDSRLAFENSVCLTCGSALGFDPQRRSFAVLDREGSADDGRQICANLTVAGCNWLARQGFSLCRSCELTRTRPGDEDVVALAGFAAAESAKRRLLLELVELGLPIVGRDTDPVGGLCFDLLSSENQSVTTGHAGGVVTLDLAEGDDVHREQLRVSMDEPYRTLLGHFRHEIGHYYFTVLIDSPDSRREFESLFGDPDLDYASALDRHYAAGAPAGWDQQYVSSYATMHPAEDWAETFAHYLHIRDTLDTAAAFGMSPADAGLESQPAAFDRIVEWWIPLTWALNMVNRSMGHTDLYPFVLSPTVLDKMRLVHRLVVGR